MVHMMASELWHQHVHSELHQVHVVGLRPVLDLDLLQFHGVDVLLDKFHLLLTQEVLDEFVEFLMDIVSLVLYV